MTTRCPPRVDARDRGQAAVEFALALPIVVLLVLGIVQLVVVARDQLAVELAAREAARAAAVSADPAGAAARAAADAVTLDGMVVSTAVNGELVTVTVSTVNSTDVMLVGAAIGDVTLTAQVTMHREPPPD